METILQAILDLAGVNAALVLDSAGALLAHRGRAIYDADLSQKVSAGVVKVVDSVQLQQPDWETITASFADGKLLLRNLGSLRDRTYLLAVIADATLNASFATVAVRVATNRLRKALADGPPAPGAASGFPSASGLGAAAGSASALSGLGARAAPAAASGLSAPSALAAASASGFGTTAPGASSSLLSGSGVGGRSSSLGLSRIPTADPASAAFLERAAKTLARQVGPVAKVYVEEAVRRVAAGVPFAMSHAPQLVEELANQVEDADDRAQFLKAVKKA